MPSARDDYLIRMIQQAAAAMRRLREKLLGGGSGEEVVREASAAIGELLGPQFPLLDRLDPTSAAQIVGNVETVRAWIALIRVQEEAARAGGDASAADRFAQRANALEKATEGASPRG